MRNPNGYGCIRKLTGKRRKPYGVYITTGYTLEAPVPGIDFLQDILTPETFEIVTAEYNAYREKLIPVARQQQACLGYYATRQEAMIALADYNKSPYDLNKREVTFEQAYSLLHESSIKDMGKSSYRAYTGAYKKCESLTKMRMCEIRTAHLQEVVDRNSNMSHSTQNNIIVLFHAIFNLCLMNDFCEKDYSKFVVIKTAAKKKDKTPFSKEEVRTLWSCSDLIAETTLVMIYTGMRISELLNVKKSSVHIDERWIDLQGTKTRAARRAVPLHKDILPIVKEWMSLPGSLLIPGELPYRKYRLRFDALMEQCGTSHTPHECRHTFVSIAAASEINPVLLKKIVGHATSDVTEGIYTHAYIADLVSEIDKFSI